MVLLQLYMPWRNESDIMDSSPSYEEKFNDIFSDIEVNILNHEPYFGVMDIDEIDLEDNSNFMAIDDSEDDTDDDNNNTSDNEYSAFDPSLLDFDSGFEDGDIPTDPVGSSSVTNSSIPLDSYYEMCSQLNEGQQDPFNYIMKWAMRYMLHKDNDEIEPDPFHIFLTGGAGVGKTFLINVLIEYLKKILVFPGQNPDEEPSIAITASTGKAACNINGTTVHSAFGLPCHGPLKYAKTELKGQELQKLQLKYKHLKVLIVDEVSMIGRLTFDDLNKFLRQIKDNDSDFGGISVLLIGDLFQLPPVKQNSIFDNPTLTDAWYLFKVNELTEIVRQNGDPAFAALLNRMRVGDHTPEDIEFIKTLADTDTENWPTGSCKLYMTNRLVNMENEEHTKTFQNDGQTLHTIYAIDAKRDVETNLHKITISKDAPISETGNLPYSLKLCEGSRVMLTKNMDVSDRLINGSIGTVVKIHRRAGSTNPSGVIFVKFDDPDAGNKTKSNRRQKELKDCVPIEVTSETFPVSKRKNKTNLKGERKQFPLMVAHAMTVHKAQGSTIPYMIGDMDRTSKNPKYPVTVNPGMFYTLLSRATSSDKVKILNFDESVIKCNEKAKEEMTRMKNESVLSCNHPLRELNGEKICLHNIVKWDKHICHFLSDRNYVNHSSLFCFTETYTSVNSKGIREYLGSWDSKHEHRGHGLAVCYDTAKVEIIECDFDNLFIDNVFEMFAVGIIIGNERLLLVLIYRPPSGSKIRFLHHLQDQINRLPRKNYDRLSVLGDINLD